MFCKRTIVGGNNLFYKWTTSSFLWQCLFNCFWCSVNLDSYYTSLPNDRALVPLFWPKRHLSVKYQTDTQAYGRTYVTLGQRHCACVRESLPYFPSTEHESRNLFHFLFSLWFQKNLAKTKQREQYKNYRKGPYIIEWKYCYGNVQKKTQKKIVAQLLSKNNSGLLIEEERRPYQYWSRLFIFLMFT